MNQVTDSGAGLCRIFQVWSLLVQVQAAGPWWSPGDSGLASQMIYVWQSREMGWKFLGSAGSFPGFSIATIFTRLPIFGSWLVQRQLLNRSRSHCLATGPRCLTCSPSMSSSPAVSLFFIALMPTRSSSAVNGLVRLSTPCWPSVALGTLALQGRWCGFSWLSSRSCLATWSAVTSYQGWGFV